MSSHPAVGTGARGADLGDIVGGVVTAPAGAQLTVSCPSRKVMLDTKHAISIAAGTVTPYQLPWTEFKRILI